MSPAPRTAELHAPVRGPLRVYAAIVVLYAVLVGWWVFFFSRQAQVLAGRMEAAGGALDAGQRRALEDATAESMRMFLAEGGFLLVLLLASMVLVVRSARSQVALARRQRDFVSAVTHELRSPLASARLYIESLLLGRADGEKATRYLTHAKQDLDRLGQLVEEVLTTRALVEGSVDLQLEAVDLCQLAETRCARLRELHAGAELQLSTAEPVTVRADRRALEQILDNLVSNAVKYGGAQGRVLVSVSTAGERGRLLVRDHGPGLQGAKATELTRAFVRGQDEDVRTHPGVGLGLFVVRRLVDGLGGLLSLRDADPGPGLLACVDLPLESDDGEPNP